MTYPVNAGVPSLSGTFIPEIWTSKLITKFYDMTVFGAIANTDYEGEIQKFGDTVNIRQRPDITIRNYVKGTALTYENPDEVIKQLLIDQGKYFAFNVFDIDKTQSDIALMNEWSTDGGEQLKIEIDKSILATIYTGADASNAGATAGRISGDVNLGTTAAPLALSKANIIDKIIEAGQVLDENNIPEDRFIVLPASMCTRIKTSELKDASVSGDGTSMLRNGKVGKLDRFTIYQSNNVNVTSGRYDIIFGHKCATTFAAQLTKMESMKNPNDFGDLVRSLMVYGFEVVKGSALGRMVATNA